MPLCKHPSVSVTRRDALRRLGAAGIGVAGAGAAAPGLPAHLLAAAAQSQSSGGVTFPDTLAKIANPGCGAARGRAAGSADHPDVSAHRRPRG